jgi:hypothetical protein
MKREKRVKTAPTPTPPRSEDRTGFADLVLRHRDTWCVLGNWETRFLAKQLKATRIDRPVFIAGLARAGTTILLRKLSEAPGFVTHRYSDFPFLFTPYTWALLRRCLPPRTQEPHERTHKDGIMVTDDSPEGMEEVLWMSFFGDLHDPDMSNVLDERVQRADFEGFLRDHIRKLIFARGGTRYLSKNNYNLTRLRYLARIFSDALFLLPIRGPIEHVASLMKQHLLFSSLQRKSIGARRHLQLLGHFEFGLDRRPINPDRDEAVRAVRDCWDREKEARGWAKYWALLYGYVLDTLHATPDLASRCLIVRYEDLCKREPHTMRAVCRHIDLPGSLAEDLGRGLHQPDYYTVQFTRSEFAAIIEETATVAARYGYCVDDFEQAPEKPNT